MAHFHNNALIGASGQGGYLINQSLRFNSADSAYLNRTPASAGNRKTWTWSGWVKRGALGSSTRTLFSAGTNDTSARGLIDFNDVNTLRFGFNNGTTWYIAETTAVFRDPSAWYHVVVKCDLSNATQANRAAIYVNGVQQTTNSVSWPDADQVFNNTVFHGVGRNYGNGTAYHDGYLAEVNFIDGTALTPSSFGETDTITGAWIPKKYSGSYGTNGFYLKFQSSGIGTDSSGNGNTWTANNFSTSGTGTDVMSDTPTNNWCTLNPLDKNTSASAPSDGNLSWNQSSAAWYAIRGTVGVTSGKWYWETKLDSGLYGAIGIGNSRADLDGYSAESNVWSYVNNGRLEANGTGSVWGNTYTTGDVVGVALDADAGKLWFSKNGTWQESGDPSAGTNPAVSGLAADSYFPYFVHYQTTITANFGQRGAFAYTPPTGFKALNTANLPEPTIKKGGAHFNTVLWTGNGGVQSVSGVGFQPDMTWVKSRSISAEHWINDAVRGAGYSLPPSNTYSEQDYRVLFTSFNSDGFSLDQGTSSFNQTSATYVGWNWKANGAGSSNTAGTITSTVSANATAGFSIVTWTGTGADGSYGHGLGVQPSMIIHKRRNSTSDWHVWHKGLPTKSPTNDVIYLNLTNGQNGGNSNLFRLDPTSTLIYTGSAGSHNVNGATYVDYVFSEVAGYSKFGSYVGNGSTTDGPFIWCGFTPRFILIKWAKDVSTAESWHIYDTARQTYNANNTILQPDSSGAEETPADRYIDILSNGFKLRQNGQQINRSGASYIFAAFASTPFKYSAAR